MMMEILNTVLGVANAVGAISESLGANDRPVEVVQNDVVRRQEPVQPQFPINLTINVNVYKDGKCVSGSVGTGNESQLAITQRNDSIDLDLG